MKIRRLLTALCAGAGGIRLHRRRAVLSSLGVFFGVAAVVAMLSVGEGAQREALRRVRALGTRTAWISPVKKPPENLPPSAEPQLTLNQVRRAAANLKKQVPIAGFRQLDDTAWGTAFRSGAPVVAVNSAAAEVLRMRILEGRFINNSDVRLGAKVCVVGAGAAAAMKPRPLIGDMLRIGRRWFKVIGIVAPEMVGENTVRAAGGSGDTQRNAPKLFSFPVSGIKPRKVSAEIYVPLHPGIVYPAVTDGAGGNDAANSSRGNEKIPFGVPPGTGGLPLDGCVVEFDSIEDVAVGAALLGSELSRIQRTGKAHEMSLPLDLLAEVERTRRLFNLVLGSIAAISLLVGGIGIMNIMTASVSERTREIGIRRACGARRSDIAFQFLSEAVLISIAGSVGGVAAGLACAYGIQQGGGIPAAYSAQAVAWAVALALSCGMVFGSAPALRAAAIPPAEALRAI